MGRALCVLGEFEPFGRRAEEALGEDVSSGRYLLFDPALARASNIGVEQAVMSSCGHHEEEIFIHNNVAVWSAGHHVRKRFTTPSTALKACWCSMESIPEPLLCVLHSNSLSTYTPSGEVNSVPFPFAMSSMWPLPYGLLLQRTFHGDSYSTTCPSIPVSSPLIRGRELPRPAKVQLSSSLRRASVCPALQDSSSIYFTLQHHLEEPEALHFQDFGRMRLVTDPDEQIIWTSESIPYVASYHRGRRQHSLWQVRTSHFAHERGIQRSSSMYLVQRWEEKTGHGKATQVFWATDDDNEPIVCFVIKDAKKLFAVKLSTDLEDDVGVAWTISAISAVPIVASHPKARTGLRQFDLLVLAPDGNMFLYAGRYPICTYVLPIEQLDVKRVCIQELFDAVGSSINLLTSSEKVYRCTVDLIPSSGITESCLIALSEGVRPSFYRYILSSFMECYNRNCNSGSNPSKLDSSPEEDWYIFSTTIMQWTGVPKTEPAGHAPKTSWEVLLQSSRHKTSSHYPALQHARGRIASTNTQTKIQTSGYTSMLVEVLETLHMVYEDYKLDTLRWRELWKLGVLLNNIAVAVGEYDYADHYVRDFPTLVPSWDKLSKPRTSNPVINHFMWIEGLLRGKHSRSILPALFSKEANVSVDWSRKVLGFFELLLEPGATQRNLPSGIKLNLAKGTAKSAEQRTILAMVGERFGLSHLDRLPCGISLPLRHALNNCRESPPTDWPSDAYIILGREDLAYMSASCRDVSMAAPYMLHLRATLPFTDREPDTMDGQSSDGMEHMFSPSAALRFGADLRLNEVRRVLCSSKPVAVRTPNAPDVSDPDLVAQQQAQLWQLAQRTTALSFGRGAFTLSTLRPLLTEALPIPKLVLAGRLPSQHDATVNLDVNTGNISDLTSWPEFHNGVAAGLRLAPGQAKITRTWIVYNKPAEPSYEHAGFLMALGLHRHLAVLAATDVFRYLAQEHDPTTVGILLGMAAAHRGSMDPAMSKMLYLHIPARHPPSFPELELSSLLQSAALMAVGLLYQGSAHRLTTEILLAEIGRKPGSDSSLDREGYALAAGLALGLVTLGRGKDAWGLADLLIEDRLRHYMCGGSEPSDEHRRRFDGASSFSLLPKHYDEQNQTGGQVMEGSIVNLDVTAPGATLALALMFMKTNDHVVAARLAIPDTHFALEYVRPDFILLRLVARSLILWDSVQATEEWIQSQIPEIIREAVVDGAAEVGPDADMEALAQAHVNILAGACLSIGLRYAGTANAEAEQLLYHYALYFLKEKLQAVSGAGNSSNGRHVDRGTLETCLNVALLSLSAVMAGTGHLGTFKLLRYLRRRNDTDIVYGNHMAISMAIGFLFLGGGCLTFSTSDTALAALLISLYPRFPTTPSDHRCHLQAFRHLYVLATETRCVQTMDVDTGILVYAPLQMTLRETSMHCETSFSRVSPCILPERSALKRVRVCGPRYWPQDIQLTNASVPWWEPGEEGDPFNGGVLYVKRKVGARSYADDPIGCRSLLSRALQKVSLTNDDSNTDIRDQSKFDELVGTFSSDPSLLAFAQLFCSSSGSRGDFQEFCLLALFECVSTDKPALLQTYIGLYTEVEALANRVANSGSSVRSSLSLQNLKICLAYREAAGHDQASALKGKSLIQRTFLASLAKRIDDILRYWKSGNEAVEPPCELVSYLSCDSWPRDDKSSRQKLMFACYLCWDAVPQPAVITAALKKLEQEVPEWCNQDSSIVLPMLAALLPGTPPRTLLQIIRCLQLL